MLITKKDIELSLKASEDLQNTVLRKKYLQEGENSWEDIVSRIMANLENPNNLKVDMGAIKEDLFAKRIIPGGRILSGLGKHKKNKVTLSNCYVIPIKEDSIEGYMNARREMARTFSYGGGVGTSFNIMRPANSSVSNSARYSSGVLPFVADMSNLVKLISQDVQRTRGEKGKTEPGRRAAALISLSLYHPDVIDFIKSKAYPEQVFIPDSITGETTTINGANLSVEIPEAFMEYVAQDKDWHFVFPDREADPGLYEDQWTGNFSEWIGHEYPIKIWGTISARKLFNFIAECAHKCGDPGVVFLERMQRQSPAAALEDCLIPYATNPCGEQPLESYGNCLLSALYLPAFVDNPYDTTNASFNYDRFGKSCRSITQFLNLISDLNEDLHPLPAQRTSDKFAKRIGVECTGYADMLSMMGLRYGSPEACKFTDHLYERLQADVFKESCMLAMSAPDKIAKAFLDGYTSSYRTFTQRLHIHEQPAAYEDSDSPRNTGFLTMGPTGSLSILAGNCSSGIEPVFSLAYSRKTMLSDGVDFIMVHPPVAKYCLENPDWFGEGKTVEEIKAKLHIATAYDVPIEERIETQKTMQYYVDSAISSTINLKNTATVKDIQDIYMKAYNSGLKGITVFRDGSKDFSILKPIDKVEKQENLPVGDKPDQSVPVSGLQRGVPAELPMISNAIRQRAKCNGGTAYVTVTIDEYGNPLELFSMFPDRKFDKKNSDVFDVIENLLRKYQNCVSRMVSLGLRYGVPAQKVAQQIEKVGFAINDPANLIARVLNRTKPKTATSEAQFCPECGSKAVVYEGGCATCRDCGYSKCN